MAAATSLKQAVSVFSLALKADVSDVKRCVTRVIGTYVGKRLRHGVVQIQTKPVHVILETYMDICR